MLKVQWATNTNGKWCELYNTDFSGLNISGVYIIFIIKIDKPCVIKVGQSTSICQRLMQYDNDEHMLYYLNINRNKAYVTWVELNKDYLDGVEVYLGKIKYNPLIAERFPNANPISVNTPF